MFATQKEHYMNFSYKLIVIIILCTLSQCTLGRIGSTTVYLYNPNASGNLADKLNIVFKGVQSDGKPLEENKFSPATGEHIVIQGPIANFFTSGLTYSKIAEFPRMMGIENGTTYTIKESLFLPAVGQVDLIQKVQGTKYGSKLFVGHSAPELGLPEQVFDNTEWHQLIIQIKSEDGRFAVGEYIISYCTYYLSNFGPPIAVQHPVADRIDQAKRAFLFVGTLANAALNMYLIKNPQVGSPYKKLRESAAKDIKDYETSVEKAYEFLGSNPGDLPEDITKKYRKMALTHHPDRPEGSEEKFKDLKEAYDIIATPEKLADYKSKSLGFFKPLIANTKLQQAGVLSLTALLLYAVTPKIYPNVLYRVDYRPYSQEEIAQQLDENTSEQ